MTLPHGSNPNQICDGPFPNTTHTYIHTFVWIRGAAVARGPEGLSVSSQSSKDKGTHYGREVGKKHFLHAEHEADYISWNLGAPPSGHKAKQQLFSSYSPLYTEERSYSTPKHLCTSPEMYLNV